MPIEVTFSFPLIVSSLQKHQQPHDWSKQYLVFPWKNILIAHSFLYDMLESRTLHNCLE